MYARKKLEGLAADVQKTLDGSDVSKFVISRINEIKQHPAIDVHTGVEVRKTEGYVGNFITTLTDDRIIEHGVIIIASGGVEYQPSEYGCGRLEGVITQRQLERRLTAGNARDNERYVMIQCVGSREEPANFCSRVCCMDAVKNAITIKEKAPAAQVAILYRDIRTYGLQEEYYQKARRLGVLFFKYRVEAKPEVSRGDHMLKVKVHDQYLQRLPGRTECL